MFNLKQIKNQKFDETKLAEVLFILFFNRLELET